MSKESVLATVFNENKDRILVVKRRDVPIWVLPGGGVDPGERAQNAAIREVKEETGLDTTISKKLGEYYPVSKLAYLTHVYECIASNEETKPSSETTDVGFFPIDALPQPFFHLHEEIITDALTGKNFPYRKPLKGITYWNLLKYFIRHPIRVIRIILSRAGIPINK